MKRVYISAVMLIAVALCCYAALRKIENTVTSIISCAEMISHDIQSENFTDTEQTMRQIEQLWQRNKNFLRIISGSQQCDKLEEAINHAKIWITQKEKSPEAISELSNLILSAKRILQSQRPGMVNLL